MEVCENGGMELSLNRWWMRLGVVAVCLAASALAARPAQAQDDLNKPHVPKVMPVPPLNGRPVPDPADPPPQTVEDKRDGIEFHLPAGWNLARKDGEFSTFHLDARSAPRAAQLRTVATIAFNPYPRSTFSGALVYLSVTPHAKPAACEAQATAPPNQPEPVTVIGDRPFKRGHDEHGRMCTEARDEVFTAMRGGACVRFDLAINQYCGSEGNGAHDMTEKEIENIETRMETIVGTVRFVKR